MARIQRDEFLKSKNVRELLGLLDEELERLRVSYEKYFVGVDKVPPVRERQRLERLLRHVTSLRTNNTELRFRVNGVRSRFVTFNHYWTRILRQIEEGTYKRDLDRMARKQRLKSLQEEQAKRLEEIERERLREQQEAEEADTAPHTPPDTGESKPAAAKIGPPPATAAQRRRTRSASKPAELPPGMDSKQVRTLFKELVAAKKAAGEATDGLSYGNLVKKLAAQTPKIKAKHGDKKVRFEVATVGGKVRLRARTV